MLATSKTFIVSCPLLREPSLVLKESHSNRKQRALCECRGWYSPMCSEAPEIKLPRCRMLQFKVALAIFLLVAWIPSTCGWGHQEFSSASSRLVVEEEDVGGIQTVLVVANDGRPEHFASVQAAVDAVPMWNYLRWVIYVKPGRYEGPVVVPEGKDYITFLGESAESTVLTYNRKACDKKPDGSEYTILDCPSVIVDASNFVAKGITFENSAPKPDDFDYNSQAPAIRVSGDNCAFYECVFLGWQDTLYADQGKHYYKDSRIEGNVDFILGYASAVFENCTIFSRGEGFITAQSRWCEEDCLAASNSTFVTSNSTFVILKSNVTGYDLATYNSTGTGLTYLGRPWREYARVVFIDTTLGEHIAPEGWVDWMTDTGPLFAHDYVYFGEFNSTGPGANSSSRIPWSHQLSEGEAQGYRDVEGFLDTRKWLKTPPSLQELKDTNMLPEQNWDPEEVSYRKEFPPRRWKRLNTP